MLDAPGILLCDAVADGPDAVGAGCYDSLLSRIHTKRACVGIIGLGYVGLPLARAFAAKGFPVLGFDIDPAKVVKLQRGESYIGHIASELIHWVDEC